MKYTLYFLVIFACLGMTSCATTSSNKKVVEEYNEDSSVNRYADLAGYLKSKGNLLVSGTGAGVGIQIRGINSINGDTRPFFYVDNVPFGRDYNNVNSAINVNEIANIQVISSLSQLALYGEDGNSGVIKIKTKRL